MQEPWYIAVGWCWWQAFGSLGGFLAMIPYKLVVGYWGLFRGRNLPAEETVELTLLTLTLGVMWGAWTLVRPRLLDYDARWDFGDIRWYLCFGSLVGNLSGCTLSTLWRMSWKTISVNGPKLETDETGYRRYYIPHANLGWERSLPGPAPGLQNILCDGERFRAWGRSIDNRCRRILKNYRSKCATEYTIPTGPRTILPTDSPITPPPGFGELSPGGQLVFLCCVVGMEEFAGQDPGSGKWRKACTQCGWCRRFPEGLNAAGVCRLGCG